MSTAGNTTSGQPCTKRREFPRRKGWKQPPANTLDQSTRDYIAANEMENSPEGRRAFLLAALDLSYTVLYSLSDPDEGEGIACELLMGRCDDENDWGHLRNLLTIAVEYLKPRAGKVIYPAFLTDWWIDNKEIPPEMSHLVEGKKRGAGPETKRGPSLAVLAHEDELWGDDDDEDEEGGDDE